MRCMDKTNKINFLLVFDKSINTTLLKRLYEDNKINKITLFPLTGDCAVRNKINSVIKKQSDNSICWLNSTNIINEEVNYLRQKICKWSADIGNSEVQGKRVKDWFILPGFNVSTWWFSLLSEKNTLKTNAFFQAAQVQAVKKALKTGQYDQCIIAIVDRNLRQSIKNVAVKLNITTKIFPVVQPGGIKSRIKRLLRPLDVLSNLFLGVSIWLRFLKRSYLVKRYLG